MGTLRHTVGCLICMALLQALTGPAQRVTTVAGGGFHSLFLKDDGSLWAMGLNDYGQLGDGTTNNINVPEEIVNSNVTAIAAGEYHSLFLKSDGSLWGMGYNWFGQLGDGTTNNVEVPEDIVASNVTAIAAGYYHCLFLKSDGSLWAMGYNHFGQLGDGTLSNTNVPQEVVSSNVTAIAAGGGFSLFAKSDGSLWGMGDSHAGQLGVYAQSPSAILPVQIRSFFPPTNVVAIAGGNIHDLFIKTDGSLWGLGDNSVGQLGAGGLLETDFAFETEASNVTDVASESGANHTLFLKKDGSLWAMGYNQDGELGDGTYNNTNTNQPEEIVAANVIAIAAGRFHSLFVKNDGSLWDMGTNGFGQLGDGTYNQTNRPEEIVAGIPGYNEISAQSLDNGSVVLKYVGNSGASYALDRSSSLAPTAWVPQATNSADANGILVFTNFPGPTPNNFWRIRQLQ